MLTLRLVVREGDLKRKPQGFRGHKKSLKEDIWMLTLRLVVRERDPQEKSLKED